MPAQRKPAKPPPRKPPAKRSSDPAIKRPADDGSFTAALADLLRSRKITIPKGLTSAPPAAYAGQGLGFVERLAKLSDAELKDYADKIGGYVARQKARAKAAWDGSPLIVELRRRKLKEPAMPEHVVGFSVSLVRPLKGWSDAEIVRAVNEWVKRSSR